MLEIFEFSFDRRVIPEEDIDKVIEEVSTILSGISEKLGIKCGLSTFSALPPAITNPNSKLVRACIETLRRAGINPIVKLSPKRNDMIYYIKYLNKETICIGPGIEEVTHSVDEYTEIGQLVKAVEVYLKLIELISKLS